MRHRAGGLEVFSPLIKLMVEMVNPLIFRLQLMTRKILCEISSILISKDLEEWMRAGPEACQAAFELVRTESLTTSSFPAAGSKENTYFFPIFRRRQTSDLKSNLTWFFDWSSFSSLCFHTWVRNLIWTKISTCLILIDITMKSSQLPPVVITIWNMTHLCHLDFHFSASFLFHHWLHLDFHTVMLCSMWSTINLV